MTMQNPTTSTPATKMTAIEKALAAARAKKAAREAATTADLREAAEALVPEEHDDGTVTFLDKKVKATKPAKTKAAPVTDDAAKAAAKAAKEAERAAAKAAREEERTAAKAKRDEARAAKKAEAAAAAAVKKSAHMSKVDRAAAKLPALRGEAKAFLDDISSNISVEQMTALALHIQHVVRRRSTEAAVGQKLAVGDRVTIVNSADPRFIGMTGTVTKAARLRCFVDVGAKKPVYLFVSDVAVA